MSAPRIDQLLIAYQRRPLRSAPTNLGQRVWRVIRLRQATMAESFWDGVFLWLSDRRLVGFSLAASIVIGFTFTMTTGHVSARQALGLNVFSHQGYSPLVALAQNR